jgi:hypothetical protein
VRSLASGLRLSPTDGSVRGFRIHGKLVARLVDLECAQSQVSGPRSNLWRPFHELR